MKCSEYRITLNNCREFVYLIPLSDLHIGTINCDIGKLKATIDWIKRTPNAYWIGMGDYAEFIAHTDKRFDPASLAIDFRGSLDNLHIAQCDYLYKLLNPIHSRCVGLLEGNHEATIRDRYHISVVDYLATRLNTKNLTYTAMLRLMFGVNNGKATDSVIIYASHGFGGGINPAAPLNRLMQMSGKFDADIYLAGHTHRKICGDLDILEMNRRGEPRLMERKQLFGICGTFYKTYEDNSRSYAERNGASPTPTGTLKIRIEPFRTQRINGPSRSVRPHLHISA